MMAEVVKIVIVVKNVTFSFYNSHNRKTLTTSAPTSPVNLFWFNQHTFGIAPVKGNICGRYSDAAVIGFPV